MGGVVGKVFHKAEDLGSSAVHDVSGAVSSTLNAGEDLASKAVSSASSAATGLYDSGKAGLSSVSKAVSGGVDDLKETGESLAAEAVRATKSVAAPLYHDAVGAADKVGDVAGGALHTAEKDIPGVKGLVGLGKDALGGAAHLGSDVLHKIADKGPLHGVVNFLDLRLTGHNFLSKGEEKYDSNITSEVDQEVKEGDNPQDMGKLIKQVEGIHGDQTRIQDISKMYGIQANQMDKALGVKNESSWSGWANQAAGLVGDVHGGKKGISSLLGQLSGSDDDLAQGNKKVFTDIAPVTNSFVNNVDQFQSGGKFDASKFNDWWNKQTPEMKESSANDPKFKQGFEDYAQAKYATNPDNQHAWMTAGTVRMAQHEQAELQPEIAGAMHGGILGGLVNDANHLIDKIPGGQIVGAPLGAGTGALNKGSGILSTQLIGGVSMGNGNNLDVSQNVKGPDGVSVPTDIRGSSGAARAELNQAAADSHTYLGQVQGTGANDYSNLDQRLRVLTANIIAYSDTHIPNRD